MKPWLKKRAILWITKDLLKTISEEDVLRTQNGSIVYRGRVLSKDEEESIMKEADFLSKSTLLRVLLDDLQFLANQTIFEKSTSFDDVLFGKAQLYVVDILKKKIKNLAK